MLPKPLYEALPYGYFIVGSALWLAHEGPLQLMAGMLLYFAGAQQWILRSHYRRGDRIRANLINRHHERARQQLQHPVYPRWLYETLPFAYIGSGYLLANLIQNPGLLGTLTFDADYTSAASLSLIICGYLVLILRGQNRLWRAYPRCHS